MAEHEEETKEETKEEATAETKEETKEEIKATDIKVEPVSVVPDKYELTLPDESLLDSSIIDEIAAIAKERGLSNEDAQTLLEDRSNTEAKYVESINTALDETHKAWDEEVKNDPDIGGDNYRATGELVFRAGEFLGEDYVKTMKDTGLGKEITIVRAMRKLGEALGDDKLIQSKAKDGGGGEEDKIGKFYDHPTSQQKKVAG